MIEVAGYATAWADAYPVEEGRYEQVGRGAFDLRQPIPLHYAHAPRFCFGYAECWEDNRGIAFRASLPATWQTMPLVRGMMSGRILAASIGPTGQTSLTYERRGDRQVQTIVRGQLDEISLCERGACPSAVAWLVDAADHELTSAQASARRRWQLGRMQARLNTPEARAALRAYRRPPADVLAAIDRLLALPRPAGWCGPGNSRLGGARR